MKTLTPLIALIRKDILLLLTDRRALMLNLLMPIVLGGFFGFLFGGNNSTDNAKIKIGLVQLDASETGQKLSAAIKGDSTLQVEDLTQDAAKDLVTKGKLSVAVVIPENFGKTAGSALFGAHAKPILPIYYDPSQGTVLAMVKGILTQHVMQIVSSEMFNGTFTNASIDEDIAKLEQRSDATSSNLLNLLRSVKTLQKNWATQQLSENDTSTPRGLTLPFDTQELAMSAGPSQYNGYAHSLAGMGVQFVLFMAMAAGLDVLLAKRLGIWKRIAAAPVGTEIILLARLLSSALIGFVLLLFIFCVAVLFFKVQIAGSLPGLIGICACFALMAASFGLLIAAIGKTPEAARGLSSFAILIMVMLGGAWVPAFIFPQWLQSLTLIMPTRWAVDGFDAMTWRGLGWDAALPAMAVQLAFAILFGGLAWWRFRSQVGTSRSY